MSTDTWYEEQDTQQVQEVAKADDDEVQALMETLLDRWRYERTSVLRDYLEQTHRTREPLTSMSESTAIDLSEEVTLWAAQACDDRDGMIDAYGEGR